MLEDIATPTGGFDLLSGAAGETMGPYGERSIELSHAQDLDPLSLVLDQPRRQHGGRVDDRASVEPIEVT